MTRRENTRDALLLTILLLVFAGLGWGAWREGRPRAQLETVVICQTASTCRAVHTWRLR